MELEQCQTKVPGATALLARDLQPTVRLVGPDEFDAANGRISIESPLGRALVGKEVDVTFRFQRPAGGVEYTVTGIRYE